ncbi:MAG TPA: hypothetical protein VEI07_07075 [Planctomycetaceae bacterium]|nr:hypothetical protein [Planctomycetaceae bacterium]
MTKPVLQALLLADHVYQDKATGKHIICGVFSELTFGPFVQAEDSSGTAGGAKHIDVSLQRGHDSGSPWAYISLTELKGEYHFELRYVDLQDNAVILQLKFGVRSPDPLQTVEIVIPLPRLPLPLNAPEGQRERACALELLCEDELIGSHRVMVRPIKEKGQS